MACEACVPGLCREGAASVNHIPAATMLSLIFAPGAVQPSLPVPVPRVGAHARRALTIVSAPA
jgi:hypothetical protein